MKLRKLELKDAPLMLEWMHNPEVVNFMQANFAEKTLQDCETFIKIAQNSTDALHLAVVDDSDIYMGTVSLKSITKEDAEFAITMRKTAMGKGYAQYAMKEIIRIGFEELHLEHIYWYVNSDNQRAVRFYDKQGYQHIDPSEIGGGIVRANNYMWYQQKQIRRGEAISK